MPKTPTRQDPYEYLRLNDGDLAYYAKNKNLAPGKRFYDSLNENDKWIVGQSGVRLEYSIHTEDVQRAIQYLESFGLSI